LKGRVFFCRKIVGSLCIKANAAPTPTTAAVYRKKASAAGFFPLKIISSGALSTERGIFGSEMPNHFRINTG